METTEIIIKNPKSGFNSFKRILSITFGFLFIYIFLKALQAGIDDIFGFLAASLTPLFLSGALIYYGVFRSKIHKKYYFKFMPDRVEGRFQTFFYNNRAKGNVVTLFDLLLDPSYEEINSRISKYKNIEIIKDTVVLTLLTGKKTVIPLQHINYKQKKEIKARFLKYKEVLEGNDRQQINAQ